MNLQEIQEQNINILIQLDENNSRLLSIINRLNSDISETKNKSDNSSDEKGLSRGLILDINNITANIKSAINYNSLLVEKLEIALFHYGTNNCANDEIPTSK